MLYRDCGFRYTHGETCPYPAGIQGPLSSDTTSAGKAFVAFYYAASPPIAHRIARSEGLRCLVRCLLMPFVGMAWLFMTYSAIAALLAIVYGGVLAGTMIWALRRAVAATGKM